MDTKKRLTRSANKVLAGVCGGIAEYFELDPTLVRVAYAALTIFTTCFPGILLYIIMMILMPQAPGNKKVEDVTFEDVKKE